MYACLKMGYKPAEFVNLPLSEKAFVIASIEKHLEAKKKQQKETEAKAPKARRRGRRRR